MQVKLKFITRDRITHRQRISEVTITAILDTGNLRILKQLWECEHIINNLPDTDTRLHLDVME